MSQIGTHITCGMAKSSNSRIPDGHNFSRTRTGQSGQFVNRKSRGRVRDTVDYADRATIIGAGWKVVQCLMKPRHTTMGMQLHQTRDPREGEKPLV